MPVYTVILRAKDSSTGIRALRAALKLLLRKFDLRAISVEQTADPD